VTDQDEGSGNTSSTGSEGGTRGAHQACIHPPASVAGKPGMPLPACVRVKHMDHTLATEEVDPAWEVAVHPHTTLSGEQQAVAINCHGCNRHAFPSYHVLHSLSHTCRSLSHFLTPSLTPSHCPGTSPTCVTPCSRSSPPWLTGHLGPRGRGCSRSTVREKGYALYPVWIGLCQSLVNLKTARPVDVAWHTLCFAHRWAGG
jgi:hypothetical protein